MSTVDVAPPVDSVTSLSTPNQPSPPPPSEPLSVPAPSNAPNEAAQSTLTPEPIPADAQNSQPVTAAASPSSQAQQLDDADANEAATYGTRSRNRGGRARPNYADDKELDLEIEAAGRITQNKGTKKVIPVADPVVSDAPPTAFSAVNNHIANIDGDAPAQEDSHAGTPAPAPAPSKKRKQPGSSSTIPNTPAAYTTGPRSKAPQPAHYVETNMMSFSRGGAKLNAKKQLVADDGTALSANGMAACTHLFSPTDLLRPCLPRLRTSWRSLLPCPHHGVSPCWQRSYRTHRRDSSELVLQT